MWYTNIIMEKLKLAQISARFNSIKLLPAWLKSLGPWADQLKSIREVLGLSQKQLAKRLDTTQISMSRLENKNANPTLKTMTRIADTLNCDLIVAMVPRKELDKTVEDLAEKKADELMKQSIANAAMELQRPNDKIAKISRDALVTDLIENKRGLLWED